MRHLAKVQFSFTDAIAPAGTQWIYAYDICYADQGNEFLTDDVTLNYVAAPEPSSLMGLLVCCGSLAASLARRLRK